MLGSLCDLQLKFLRDNLNEAEAQGQKAVILCHIPTKPGSCSDGCLLWNYEEVLEILEEVFFIFFSFFLFSLFFFFSLVVLIFLYLQLSLSLFSFFQQQKDTVVAWFSG